MSLYAAQLASLAMVFLALVLLAAPASARRVDQPELPASWLEQGSHHPLPDSLTLSLALRESGEDEIARIARDVSDPRSPSYGRFLRQAQIDALAAPAPQDVAAVRSWLATATGCAPPSGLSDRLLHVHCSLAGAQELLQTSFRRLYNPSTGQHAVE
eukprot:COSAG05_NODE_678_length_7984_cov_3.957134_5_plen_157_part_00